MSNINILENSIFIITYIMLNNPPLSYAPAER